MPDIKVALKEAEALVADLKTLNNGDTAQRLAMLQKVDNIRSALEEPYDKINYQFRVASAYSAAYTLLMIGALDKLAAAGTMTTAELAEACNADPSTINRPMRMLTCQGIISEPEPDTFTHTPFSLSYLPQGMGGFLRLSADLIRCQLALPDYIKSHKPEDLLDLKKSLLAYIRGKEGKTYYECISEDPVERDLWNRTLQMVDQGMPILNMFPFPSLKEKVEKNPERPFVVDIGGGRGQALLAIRGECGGSFGAKTILQDLPDVLDSIRDEDIPGIEKVPYDIFSGPQPVKNAHIYFMRRLLHDFYNPVCVEILKNTVPAMGPDSRLLICDMLVPEKVDVGGPQELYWLDWSLICLGGKEKTLKEFIDIFDQAGLELVNVYPSGVGATGIVEARLKQST